jgi:hypothetical protein
VVDRRPFPTLVAALAVALLAVPVAVVPVTALAQDAPAPAKHADDPTAVEARRHYEEGTKAFNLGEYPRAIGAFKAAYNAKPDPSLLYNIAQSFRLQGDAGQAIFFYKSFLRNLPATPNRKEVEARIRTLEKQAEEQRKEAVPVVTPPAPALAPPPASSPVQPLAIPSSEASSPPKDTTAKPVEETPPSTAPPPLAPQPPLASSTVDLTAPPTDVPPAGKPIYKKWWFWTGIGAVLLIGVVAVAARDKPPSTTLGLFDPTFVKP